MTLLRSLPGLLLLATSAVHAHPGHGALQAHSHATDVYGFVVVVVLAGAAIWLSRSE